jgi:hypothetical protein
MVHVKTASLFTYIPELDRANLFWQGRTHIGPAKRPGSFNFLTFIVDCTTPKKVSPIKLIHRVPYFKKTVNIMQKTLQNDAVRLGDFALIKDRATPI